MTVPIKLDIREDAKGEQTASILIEDFVHRGFCQLVFGRYFRTLCGTKNVTPLITADDKYVSCPDCLKVMREA